MCLVLNFMPGPANMSSLEQVSDRVLRARFIGYSD